MTALNIAEPQVLALSAAPGEDEAWHHWICLRRIKDAEWIVLTAARDVVQRNLASVRVIMLTPGSPYPPNVADEVVPAMPISEDELILFHATAERLTGLLDATAPAASALTAPRTADWRVSDVAAGRFGEVVGDDVMADVSTGVTRGSVGLARLDDLWYPVEAVDNEYYSAWVSAKRCGGGRDPRLASDERDARGRRFMTLNASLARYQPTDKTKEVGWPHPGPSATLEVLQAITGANRELVGYDENWCRTSGIHGGSAVRAEHRTIFHTLALLQSVDQLDLTNLAGAELLARRAVQIERAVKADPQRPNFQGLEKMVQHSLDEAGGVTTTAFTAHFAGLAESEARILRQNRLYRAELGAQGPKAVTPADLSEEEEDAAAAGQGRGRRRRGKGGKKPGE